MVGKKGFIRIIEAIIAIVIVFGFIVLALPNQKDENPGETPYEIEQIQNKVFNEITNNVSFRRCILNLIPDQPDVCGKKLISPFIMQEAAMGYSYEIKSQVNQVHGTPFFMSKDKINPVPLNQDVYTKSIIVSVDDVLAKGQPSTDTNKRYYKFTLYLWYTI